MVKRPSRRALIKSPPLILASARHDELRRRMHVGHVADDVARADDGGVCGSLVACRARSTLART
jgi:hypothetical protein